MEAYGIATDSNQQSNTSSIRFAGSPHSSHFSSILSIPGRCKSSSFGSFMAFSFNSSILLTAVTCSLSHSQTGSGEPQKRLREMPQSRTSASQLPNSPSRICLGTQFIFWLFFTRSSLIAVTLTNQDGVAKYISGVSQRQQNG